MFCLMLRMSKNRVLRKIFGPKREEVTGDWRQLHNEELHDVYFLWNVIRVIKWRVGHVAYIGENTIWREDPVCGRPWFRWEDSVRMDMKEIEWRGMECINLAPNSVKWWAVMNMVMNVQVVTIIQCHRKSAALIFKPDSTLQEKLNSWDSLLAVWLNTDNTANASCFVQI